MALWRSIKIAKHIIMQTRPHDSWGTLVFWGYHKGGDKYECSRLKWAVFDQYVAIAQKWCEKNI